MIGAKVIAAAGSDDRVRARRSSSAPTTRINYNTHNIQDEVMRLTGGKGVNVLYDNIANPKVLPQAFMALGFRGRLVTAGAHGGPNVTIDFAHLYHKQITIKRPARLPPARRAEMLRRRGRGQGQAADRAHPAAVAGGRGAPADRNRAKSPGKIVLDPTLG